jgi:hypothetical protein
MRALQCWWLGAGAAGAVLAGAFFVGCSVLPPSGVPNEVERRARLEADLAHLGRRQELIHFLGTELAEARMSLREAGALWRAEDVGSPRHLRMRIELNSGKTDEERYCRSVLWNVARQLELAGDARAPAILTRLEAELAALTAGSSAPPAPARTPRNPAGQQAPAPARAGGRPPPSRPPARRDG